MYGLELATGEVIALCSDLQMNVQRSNWLFAMYASAYRLPGPWQHQQDLQGSVSPCSISPTPQTTPKCVLHAGLSGEGWPGRQQGDRKGAQPLSKQSGAQAPAGCLSRRGRGHGGGRQPGAREEAHPQRQVQVPYLLAEHFVPAIVPTGLGAMCEHFQSWDDIRTAWLQWHDCYKAEHLLQMSL